MKFVRDFGDDLGGLEARVGARGRSLAQMTKLGLKVPPGFVVSDVVCRRFLQTGDIPEEAWNEIVAAVDRSAAAFGSSPPQRPVLFSVRSSPAREMPALFDSALYLGATPQSRTVLADMAGERLAATVRLGLMKTFGRLRGLSPSRYAAVVADIVGPLHRLDWTHEQIDSVAVAYEALVVDESQRPIPTDLDGQLLEGVESVYASWDGSEARLFRRSHGLSDDEGMGLVIHPMIVGETDSESGAGIAVSRNPADGAAGITGIFTRSISRPQSQLQYPGLDNLAELDSDSYKTVTDACGLIESIREDMVRLDFVRERSDTWFIEARPADRTIAAAVRCAVDLVDEGAIPIEEALLRVDPEKLTGMLHPRLDETADATAIATGTPASPGAVSGPLVFSAGEAISSAEAGRPAILTLREVMPRDLDGVVLAAGLITSHGGGSSHAALAARGAGTPSVTGVADLLVNPDDARFGSNQLERGDVVTIDGGSGTVYRGELATVQPPAASYLDRLLGWADEVRRLGVWANADTARAATAARAAGAEGIGLARTEYMFHGARLAVVRRILVSEDGHERAEALEELENLQIEDFEELLRSMDGTPVVVRFLDPPVHEFLPTRATVHNEMAKRGPGESIVDLEALDAAIDQWSEVNPMLGLRGVRLAVVVPEIYRVQVLAALEAVRRRLDDGGDPRLALMIPLVGSVEELHLVRDMIEEEVHSAGRLLEVAIGTMIELPRAALIAGDLALESDFFSFGTNDLTQTVMGLSRDDAEEAFLRAYVDQGLLSVNPFQEIDEVGVGGLIRQAIAAGRAANPGLEVGVCGEHGGDPVSIGHFHNWGVDYVSCSPPRLPIARLAAAQAALRDDA